MTDNLANMTTLDYVILGILALFMFRGFLRGFVLTTADILGLVVTIAVAFAGYRPLAALIVERSPFGEAVALPAAFIGLVIGAGVLYLVVVRTVLAPLGLVARSRVLRLVNRWFGILPGLVQGVLVAVLLVAGLSLLPENVLLANQEEGSVAPQFRRASSELAPRVREVATLVPQIPRPNRSAPPKTAPPTDESDSLDIPQNLRLRVNAPAENRMLELINRDRKVNGLAPLVMDEQSRAVARSHSREMFNLRYFAHESPRTGTVGDRLEKAGVPFLAAGENLAFQPDVETAHRRLMESPGHRKNLLTPGYKKVGIGILDSGRYGQMYTQVFTN